MPSVEILDETVVVVTPAALADAVGQRARWATWWPGLQVVIVADRGAAGLTWSVSGELVGTTQVEMVPQADGVLVRYRLTADPSVPGTLTVPRPLPDSPHGRREAQEIRRRRAVAWKRTIWALQDELGAR